MPFGLGAEVVELSGGAERRHRRADDGAHQSNGRARAAPSVAVELHHDLRQPLAAIAALAEAGQAVGEVPAAALLCFERIADTAQELLALCRDVLDHAADQRLVSLGHVAESIVERCRALGRCGIDLDVDHTMVLANEVGLRRVLWNVIDNACRAAGPGGRVRVSVQRRRREARVEISDSGPGFGAGRPGQASVGLDITSRIARREGWRLEVLASDLGGAAVRIGLPLPQRRELAQWPRLHAG